MARESIFLVAWRLNKALPLLIAGLLLLNVAAYALMTYVMAPRIDGLERRYIEQQSLVRQGRKTGGATGSPQEIYQRGTEDLKQFQAAIPSRIEFTAMIGEIFSLAEKAGLAIDRISYDPQELPDHELLRYALNFSVGGDYGQVKKFVFSLEQSERLIVIEDLSLSGGGRSEKGEVNLRISLSTYFRMDVP